MKILNLLLVLKIEHENVSLTFPISSYISISIDRESSGTPIKNDRDYIFSYFDDSFIHLHLFISIHSQFF